MVDGDTAIFGITQTLTDGNHTVTIAAGAIDDVQDTPIEAFTATFYNDVTAPRVVASSIQEGQTDIPAGDLVYTVTFSEAMNPFVDTYAAPLYGQYRGGYLLSRPASSSMAPAPRRRSPTPACPTMRTRSPCTAVRVPGHRSGIALDGEPVAWPIPPNQSGDGIEGGDFFVDFATDAGTQALPTPLVPVNPLGSLIYQTPYDTTGTIAFTGDTDDFTINVDAGQTLTILVQPGYSLQASIEVHDPSNALVGVRHGRLRRQRRSILQTVPAATAGTYTITIGGAGSLGYYSVGLTLNAALEEEAHGGSTE